MTSLLKPEGLSCFPEYQILSNTDKWREIMGLVVNCSPSCSLYRYFEFLFFIRDFISNSQFVMWTLVISTKIQSR